MKYNSESSKRVLWTMAVILTVLTVGLLGSVEAGRVWAIAGLVTITAGAVLLHLTKPVEQTTSQAIHEARR